MSHVVIFLRRSRDKPGGVRFKDDEVNEYLNRAIDARDIERMKSEHIQNCLLTFKDKDVEQQVQCDVRRCTWRTIIRCVALLLSNCASTLDVHVHV